MSQCMTLEFASADRSSSSFLVTLEVKHSGSKSINEKVRNEQSTVHATSQSHQDQTVCLNELMILSFGTVSYRSLLSRPCRRLHYCRSSTGYKSSQSAGRCLLATHSLCALRFLPSKPSHETFPQAIRCLQNFSHPVLTDCTKKLVHLCSTATFLGQ